MNTKELAVKSFPTPAYHTWNKSHLKKLAKFRCSIKETVHPKARNCFHLLWPPKEPSEYQDPHRGGHVFYFLPLAPPGRAAKKHLLAQAGGVDGLMCIWIFPSLGVPKDG